MLGSRCRRPRRAPRESARARDFRTRSRRRSRRRRDHRLPIPPKSITAQSRPSRTSRLGLRRSLWIHTARRPTRRPQRVVPGGAAASPSMTPPADPIAARVIGVELAQRPAPAGRRADGHIDVTELGHEPREVGGCRCLVGHELVRVRLPVDPAVDRPGEGVEPAGSPFATGFGTRERQACCKLREPLPLLVQVLCPLHRRAAVGRRADRQADRWRSPFPSDSTALIGRSAISGNWASSNRRTRSPSMSSSPSCILTPVAPSTGPWRPSSGRASGRRAGGRAAPRRPAGRRARPGRRAVAGSGRAAARRAHRWRRRAAP